MTPFSPHKPCTTRDGRKVRILATDLPEPYSIAAFVWGQFEGREERPGLLCSFTKSGRFHVTSPNPYSEFDLINVPEKIRLELSVEIGKSLGEYYISRVSSGSWSCGPEVGPVAKTKVVIECVEGDGL